MNEAFVCKIATAGELERKWDEEIARQPDDAFNQRTWKQQNLERYEQGAILPYFGLLEGEVICEAIAMLNPAFVQNSEGLVDETTVYLAAFRTADAFENQGYFSRLFRFMLADLKKRGFTRATLGVEPDSTRNKAIYAHYGFTDFIKAGQESYPDGTMIDAEYYGRTL